jgi:5'(3')-deoxyribonucleotidase
MHILLDVDGVLCNFIDGMIAAHAWPISHENYSDWSYHRALGLTDEEFWRPASIPGFWLNLKPYMEASWLFGMLSQKYRITFATSPAIDSKCPSEKVEWLRENNFMDKNRANYMIGGEKWLMAKSGAVLIDDSDSNVEKFIENGGKAILYPQPWNKLRHTTKPSDKIVHVISSLEA